MKLPPYTIPDADKDLWRCGVSPMDELLRRQKECCGCKKPFVPTSNTRHCPACHNLMGKMQRLRNKAIRKAPRENVVLSEDQLHRLHKMLYQRFLALPSSHLSKHRRLDPNDGFRLVGFPYVGIRRAFVRVTSELWCTEDCQEVLRTTVVETHKGAAWEWFRQQAGLRP